MPLPLEAFIFSSSDSGFRPTRVSDEKRAPRDPSELDEDLGVCTTGWLLSLTNLASSHFFSLMLTLINIYLKVHLHNPPAVVVTCLVPLLPQDMVWSPPPRKPLYISTSTTRVRAQWATPGCLLLCFMPPPFTHKTQGWLVYFHTLSEH